jgi:hypothetical protein
MTEGQNRQMHVQDVLFDDEKIHNSSSCSSSTDNYFDQSENEQEYIEDLLHTLLNNFCSFLHFL